MSSNSDQLLWYWKRMLPLAPIYCQKNSGFLSEHRAGLRIPSRVIGLSLNNQPPDKLLGQVRAVINDRRDEQILVSVVLRDSIEVLGENGGGAVRHAAAKRCPCPSASGARTETNDWGRRNETRWGRANRRRRPGATSHNWCPGKAMLVVPIRRPRETIPIRQ